MHHRIKHFLLVGVSIVVGLIASMGTSRAAPITLIPGNSNSFVALSDLLMGGQYADGVIVGDKKFSEFFYSTLPGDDMPSAANVAVLGFQDVQGNLGISFHGGFIDLPGGPSVSDALIRFTVEVTPEAIAQGWRISDAHLFLGGVGVGDVGLGEEGFFAVDESFQGLNDTLNTYATTLGDGPQEQVLSDVVVFDQFYTRLRVTKDIMAYAGGGRIPARASVIDQSFSQIRIIPEPSSLIMLSMVGVGLCLRHRRPPIQDGS